MTMHTIDVYNRDNSTMNCENGQIKLPVIILLGGVFGVGKTTLSYNLSRSLGIKQRTSVGVISKTLQYLYPGTKSIRTLDNLERDKCNYKIFLKQSFLMCSIVNYILRIARKDGVDYIIDGVQLLPKFIKFRKNILYLFLKCSSEKKLMQRLVNSTSHRNRYRETSLEQVKKLISLQQFFVDSIKESKNVRIIDEDKSEEDVTKEALEVIKEWIKVSF